MSEENASTQDAARPPGRPRSAASHEAILRATLELLAEQGVRGTSMDAVAARAGVSKATIYRRWRSKEELIAGLLDHIFDLVPQIDTGNPREDLLEAGRIVAERAGPMNKLVPALAGEAVIDPSFAETFRAKLIAPRRGQIRSFLERAIAAGELREDADLDFFTDVLLGTVLFRTQIAGDTFSGLVDDQARLWDMVVETAGTPKGKRALARRRAQD